MKTIVQLCVDSLSLMHYIGVMAANNTNQQVTRGNTMTPSTIVSTVVSGNHKAYVWSDGLVECYQVVCGNWGACMPRQFDSVDEAMAYVNAEFDLSNTDAEASIELPVEKPVRVSLTQWTYRGYAFLRYPRAKLWEVRKGEVTIALDLTRTECRKLVDLILL